MSKSGSKNAKGKSNEEIFAQFQELRSEQRILANKLSELGMDLNEHKIVIENLRGVDSTRKCFRMVGGVLVERTVAEVLPELESNCEQLPKAMKVLEDQLTRKGEEINSYIDNHDIRVQRIDRPSNYSEADGARGDHQTAYTESEQPAKSNVLVASDCDSGKNR